MSEQAGGWKKRGKRRGGLGLAIGAVVLVVAAAAALLGLSSTSGANEVPRGVEVGGIGIGGMSAQEAEQALAERAYALNEVRVSGDGEQVTLDADSLGVEPNVQATVDNAMQVGREGNAFERLGERASGVFGASEVPLEVSYSEQAVRAQTEALASEIDQEPRQAAVDVSASGADVTSSAEGYKVNVEQTAANIRDSIENLQSEADLEGGVLEPEITTSEAEAAAERAETAVAEPATLSADGEQWRLSPDQIAGAVNVEAQDGELAVNMDRESLRGSMEEMYSSVNNPAQEADYEFAGGGVEVVPGQIGQRIESQKLMDDLASGLPEGQREYEVSVVEDEPELTTERAEELKPTGQIGTYRTTFQTPSSNSPDRVENLRIAGNALTGETVAPGEVFSTNDVLANVEYNEASTFINGQEEDALGGGLCQVASTLYMAVNYAGLEPVERHPHFALLNYIRPGFDATLWFGAENGYSGQELDMKFRNTSDGYVMIREYVRDGYLYAEVWGQPTGKEVTMDSVDQGTDSESSTWTTYKTVENADGEVTFDGVFHTDTYYSLETEDGEVPPDEVEPAPVNP